jgi:hypothetical protein
MKKLAAFLCVVAVLVPLGFSQDLPFDVGVRVGTRIPSFRLSDQRGNEQDFVSLKKANGLVLLFFRSADW